MRKLLFILATIIPACAWAGAITAEQAKSVASQFLSQSQGAHKMKGDIASLQLAYTASEGEIFAFNRAEGEGYVVVAGDDRMPAILGFSDEGSFPSNESDLPDGLRYWLECYSLQMQCLRANPQAVMRASSQMGSKAGNIYPLLGKTMWNQGAPYNQLCPTYTSSGTTKTCVTGCVATAVAQVMYYYKYPKQGAGSHSYETAINKDENDKRTLSADFSQSIYDWENMLPTYTDSPTEEEKYAVAKLMSDVGIAIDMGYGSSSGAVMRKLISALSTYFTYDKSIQYLVRSDFGFGDWMEKIDNELMQSRPVVFSGSSTTGSGHCFVIDGANAEGYYHINWGWGGSSNGYFVLTDLTPKVQGIGSSDGGYNLGQGILVNMKPNEGGDMNYSVHIGEFSTTTESVALGSTAAIKWGAYYVLIPEEGNATIRFGLGIYDSNDQLVSVAASTNIKEIQSKYNYSRTWTMTVPSTLANGNYKLKALYAPYGTSDWRFVPINRASNQYLNIAVANKIATFSNAAQAPELHIDSLTIENETVHGKQQVLAHVTVSHKGGDEFFNNLYLGITQGTSIASISDAKLVVVQPGGTTKFDMVIDAPETAGEYTLAVLTDDNNKIEGYELPLTINTPFTVDYYLTTTGIVLPTTNVPFTHLEAKATVKNTGAPVSRQIEAFLINGTSNVIVKRIYSNFVNVGTGESKEIFFNTSFTGGEVGKTYKIALRNPNPKYSTTNTIWGSSKMITITEPQKGDVNVDGLCNVGDVSYLINDILSTRAFPFDQNEADANADGVINIADVTALINIILNQ